jgi:hypothetical protein
MHGSPLPLAATTERAPAASPTSATEIAGSSVVEVTARVSVLALSHSNRANRPLSRPRQVGALAHVRRPDTPPLARASDARRLTGAKAAA